MDVGVVTPLRATLPFAGPQPRVPRQNIHQSVSARLNHPSRPSATLSSRLRA
ncbi:hypothetical protein GQ53DRAFT_754547 [Thozetella sp. PMI_491]|nr:hypothetical protein GQ53DRAFT_754547 [Thozetella sp. PMI_491]